MKTRFTIITVLLAALFTLGTVTYAAPADPPTKKEMRKELKRQRKELKRQQKELKRQEKQQLNNLSKDRKAEDHKVVVTGEGVVLDPYYAEEGDAGKAI